MTDVLTGSDRKIIIAALAGTLGYLRGLSPIPCVGIALIAYLTAEQIWPSKAEKTEKKDLLTWVGEKATQDWFEGSTRAGGGTLPSA